MKNLHVKLLFCIFAFMGNNLQIFAQIPSNDSTWQLVFVDEFTDSVPNTKLDCSKWWDTYPNGQRSYLPECNNDTVFSDMLGYRYGHSGANDSIPWFPNCVLNNGILTLESRKQDKWCKVWDSWENGQPVETVKLFHYTTGMIQSKDLFRYGYYEIKCQIPVPQSQHATRGLGPNFWLWNANLNSVNYSEIDIFEFAGEFVNEVNHHTCNNHFRECDPADSSCTGDTTFYDDGLPRPNNNFTSLGSVDFSQPHQWKTFGMEWSNEALNYLKDDAMFYTVNNHQDQMLPMKMVIDINTPSTNFCTLYDDTTLWPYQYKIDYVKVWQLRQACDSSVSYCGFNNYRYKVYKDITLGGTGCTPTITNGSHVTLRANDFILLDKGFTVESGAIFQAQINSCQEQKMYPEWEPASQTPPLEHYEFHY